MKIDEGYLEELGGKVFFFNENREKRTNIRQNQKTLIFHFSSLLTATNENSILLGTLCMRLCQYPVFRDFQIYPNFKKLACSAILETTRMQSLLY